MLSGRPSLHQLQRDAIRVERRLQPNTPSAGAGRTPTYSAVRLYLQVQKKKEACNRKVKTDDWSPHFLQTLTPATMQLRKIVGTIARISFPLYSLSHQ
ncbi:hypothetical protein Y032_0016g2919 [Ancylostoma ceylanicum]|uniref:Uncharacterized protein n=1 Tax=Ancylostoma ceylanicum TaxID=53326 RepID=A0A016V7M9_9BILA|nr:hypothetical protein Y032_0016g2919 [Ancylostoma ceylanicum]